MAGCRVCLAVATLQLVSLLAALCYLRFYRGGEGLLSEGLTSPLQPCQDELGSCRAEACHLDFCPGCPGAGLCDASCGLCGGAPPPAAASAPENGSSTTPGAPPVEEAEEESVACSFSDDFPGRDIKESTKAGGGRPLQWFRSLKELQTAGAQTPCRDAFNRDARAYSLSLAQRNGTLCVLGDGIQSRGMSSVEMLRRALLELKRRGQELPSFCGMSFSVDDDTTGGETLGYNGGARFLVPDFTFAQWREAGLCPDYESLVQRLRRISRKPARKRKCGWAGAVNSPLRVRFLNASIEFKELLDVIWPRANEGQKAGRISIEEQVGRYACVLDAQGVAGGYSGRVPMLLHSGRPLIYAQRSHESFFDRTFYAYALSEPLKPWVHFIPLEDDGDAIGDRLKWVLAPENAERVRNITANAQRFAEKHLTLEAAVRFLANQLLEAARGLAERDEKRRRKRPDLDPCSGSF